MKPNKMKQTDKQMADEILGKLFIGIEKVRKLSDLKAIRFAEWTGILFTWVSANKWRSNWLDPDYCSSDDYMTTAELYNSTEFAEWLKQIEK